MRRAGLLLLLWLLPACMAAGLLALPLQMPTVWGERLSFISYGLPWPFGWGLLHLGPLALGAAVLLLARPLALPAALGLLAAAALSAWDPQFRRWALQPWTLFLLVDGSWLLLLALVLPTRGPRRAGPSLAVLLLPLLPVAAWQWGLQRQFDGPRVATSGPDAQRPEVERMVVVVDRAPRTMAEGCAQLAALAPDPYPGHGGPGGWPRRHRVLELRLRSQLMARDDHTPPLLTYEWRPDAPDSGDCRDLGFTPPALR